MSGKHNKANNDLSNAVEVELLTVTKTNNYQGLTLKCVLVYLVRALPDTFKNLIQIRNLLSV
jgi:hypothetical protein